MISLIAVVVVGFPVVFTAGMTVALVFAADANPAEVLRTVFGSVGDWVSGIGALSAAVIAVYLANKQREDSLPKVEISQSADSRGFCIEIISVGERSVLLKGAYLRSRRLDGQARLTREDVFPKRLEFGDVLPIHVKGHQYRNFSNFISGHDGQCDLSDLEVVVNTSTRSFVVPADDLFIDLVQGTISLDSHHKGEAEPT
ncbi:hypothetical protein ACIPZ5_01890 [Pseudomonas sp. NPDC089428]|uniref:hypothetical protein n=1 Tax=Pseudomonas sp. NPDC089428 TaxID=3364467 RepID=UPI00381F7685